MTTPAIERQFSESSDLLTLGDAQRVPYVGAGAIVLGGAHGGIAVARSLGRRGVPVWFVGSDHPIARYSRYVRRRIDWDGPMAPDAVERLCALAETQGVEGWVLFPAADAELQLVAQHHERLSRHFRVITMPWGSLEALNDKGQLYELAARIGVPAPEVYPSHVGGTPPDVRFPVIIKPRSTESPNALTRAKAWRADSREEFVTKWTEAASLMGADGLVVQEMVPGDGSTQFSYAGLWDHGREHSYLTVRRTRQFPTDFGTSPFVETTERPEIAALARRILGTVGFHGLAEMDFKFDARDGNFKVLDVNTRVWAWIGLGASAGVDFAWLAWLMAIGQPVPEAIGEGQWAWRHFSQNLLSVVQQFTRDGRFDPTALGSVFRRSTSATFSWDDPLPGLMEVPVQLRRLGRRLRRRMSGEAAIGPAVRATAQE